MIQSSYALPGRGARRDRTNRQLLPVEIDRHLDGRRSRVPLQDRHIFARDGPPRRFARPTMPIASTAASAEIHQMAVAAGLTGAPAKG